MKFNRLFLILVGALALFSSCSDSDDDTDNGGKNLVSTAKAFSVSDTKKVIFSSGNLQYQPSTGKWRFAEHQYDFIGEDNKNISATYTGWIDLLGWGTGDEPARVSTSGDDYPVFSDWGTKVDDGKWFTLSTDEWQYFIDHHANKWTTVNGVAGRLFLPDDSVIRKFIHDPGRTVKSDLKDSLKISDGCLSAADNVFAGFRKKLISENGIP